MPKTLQSNSHHISSKTEMINTDFKTVTEMITVYMHKPATYWGCALAGETGELCNILKKIERDNESDAGVAHELADIFIYIEIIAREFGITLEDAILDKLNILRDRLKITTITPPPSPRNLALKNITIDDKLTRIKEKDAEIARLKSALNKIHVLYYTGGTEWNINIRDSMHGDDVEISDLQEEFEAILKGAEEGG